MWSLWPCVQRIARTSRSPTALAIGRCVVCGVDDEHLVIVADEPDVVLDVEVLSVEREDAVRPDELDARGHGVQFRS